MEVSSKGNKTSKEKEGKRQVIEIVTNNDDTSHREVERPVVGKGRRGLIKKKPFKGLKPIATRVTSGRVSYKGSFITEGDIVSVVDTDSNVYYAQVRGLLQNQFCEKFAVITWLIPTLGSPKGRFDPATYVIGPEEDIPRSLECFEFECHPPSEYFLAKKPVYPVFASDPQLGFMETEKGPKFVTLPYESNSSDDE